jgi:hypothetical protein
MDTVRRYAGTLIFFFIFVSGFLNYKPLTLIGFLMFTIYTISNVVIEIFAIKKAEKVDACITSFKENKNEDYIETAKHNGKLYPSSIFNLLLSRLLLFFLYPYG